MQICTYVCVYINIYPFTHLIVYEKTLLISSKTQTQSGHGENFGFSTLLSFPHHPCSSYVLRFGLYGSETQFCKHWRTHWSILLFCFRNWWILWHFSLFVLNFRVVYIGLYLLPPLYEFYWKWIAYVVALPVEFFDQFDTVAKKEEIIFRNLNCW